MDNIPRAVGNPRQHFVTSPKQFLLWFKWNNGKKTCYTSHNCYTSFNEHSNPSEVKLRNIFLDFDMNEDEGLTFPKVARDVKLVTEYLSEQDIAHSISFSGRQGYHLYIHTKPTFESLSNGLSLKYKSIYAHLRRELNLKTLDQRCAEPKRLCRVPGSIYVKEGKKTNRKCYPIPAESSIVTKKDRMYELSTEEIKDLNIQRSSKKKTIDNLMDDWDIEPEQMPDEDLYGLAKYKEPKGKFLKLIGEYFRPCIKSALFTSNPPHFIRVSACIKIRQLYSKDDAIRFFDKLSHKIGWIDRKNKNMRDYNINHIYNKHYKLPSCTKIMSEGYCVGSDCEYYKDLEEKMEK